ncbi:MAG: pyruvate kinase [Syntrophales bacterium]
MRKTKIVCTIGPASETPEMIEAMIINGMNVARLNFSHGTRDDHEEKIKIIRDISAKLDMPVAILLDLPGPKIRIGSIPDPGVELEPGQDFILTSRNMEGNKEMVSVSYPDLSAAVGTGDTILLADGLIEMKVVRTSTSDIYCTVITGGLLTSRKGINLPMGTINTPFLTDRDKQGLLLGLSHEVDYIALSFVRTAEDIKTVKNIIKEKGADIPVIAKIEKHEALEHLEDIIALSDGIMVARGDLGVDIPLEEVPLVQKKLIRQANAHGKTVITATQMLRSMVNSPRPTRAEAADVANAVLDGTDAVMLSEETAVGSYPLEALKVMDRLAVNAETGFPYETVLRSIPKKDISESVAHASCILADHLDSRAIVAHTRSGLTARHISRFRPRQPIIALSSNVRTLRRMTLFWGCVPRLIREQRDTDDVIENTAQAILKMGDASAGDTIVVAMGHPINASGTTTNMLRVKKL